MLAITEVKEVAIYDHSGKYNFCFIAVNDLPAHPFSAFLFKGTLNIHPFKHQE